MADRSASEINNFGAFVVIVLQFVGISLASVVVGMLIGLAASAVSVVVLPSRDNVRRFHVPCMLQLFKHTQLRKYPHKEIVVLFLCAYCAYAVGEALYLSGIMSLFFCGIILSHYNWCGIGFSVMIILCRGALLLLSACC